MAQVDFVSAPDVTPEAQTQVVVQLGTFRQVYRLWETNAPQPYDYADTLHLYGDRHTGARNPDLGAGDGSGTETRFILIPDEQGKADQQTIRYRTGLYAAARAEFFNHADVTMLLVNAALDHLKGGN